MCGIAGYLGEGDQALLRRMAEAQRHRGPDGEGFFLDRGIGFAHKRLSIIGLETGAQPLSSESGDVQLICNGEIYNYKLLRDALEKSGHRFRTDSDNEVIIHLYEDRGVEALSLLEGMFAFALWDKRRSALLLARDRMGIKPLYYAERNGTLFFASEIKAILATERVERTPCLPAIDALITYRQVPGERTTFTGVYKLLPGHYLWGESGRPVSIRPYWQIRFHVNGHASPAGEGECAAQVRRLLESAVESHMVSDVPVGATLSGGLDSTFVVALMKRIHDRPISTITVGFGDERDERGLARRVAEDLGTVHHEYTEDYDTLNQILPEVLWHMEEPVPGVLGPTYLLARRARQHLKVVLVGEGSDELFGGYERFRVLGSPLRWVPDAAKIWVYQKGMNGFTKSQKATLYTPRTRSSMDKEHDGDRHLKKILAKPGPDMLNRFLAFEQEQELPNHQLLRVDKMTMAHSVEARVPFLDRRLVEYVNSLPSRLKCGLWRDKRLLKRAAKGIVPDYVLERRKQSFSYPLKELFGGKFREWAMDMLSPRTIRGRGYFRTEHIDRLVRQTGRRRWLSSPEGKLYTLLMLELWHQIFIDPPSVRPPRTQAAPPSAFVASP